MCINGGVRDYFTFTDKGGKSVGQILLETKFTADGGQKAPSTTAPVAAPATGVQYTMTPQGYPQGYQQMPPAGGVPGYPYPQQQAPQYPPQGYPGGYP